MLLNSLENLKMKLTDCEVDLNGNQIIKLYETLEYHSGGILPLSVLKRELSLSFDETYKLMLFLSIKKILKPVYKVICDHDMETNGSKIYNTISEISTYVCDRCNKKCVLVDSVCVEFKVINQ